MIVKKRERMGMLSNQVLNKEEEIMAPECFRTKVKRLITEHWDIVANSDRDLGRTQILKMSIDTVPYLLSFGIN